MNKYRINKDGLFNILRVWSGFLKRRVRLVACGGTAMTLLNIKDSSKDIDFIVPELKEYKYLTGKLTEMGYRRSSQFGWKKDEGFIFDLYPDNTVYCTELIESPLAAGNQMPFKEFARISVGILNYYDILITKLFRSSAIDIEDCLGLLKTAKKEIELKVFEKRFRMTAAYDVSEDKYLKNMEHFLKILKREGLI